MTMTPRCQHRTHRGWTTAARRPRRVLGALALGLALMTLARPALARAGSELAPALAREAGALARSGPGARVRLAFDSDRVELGVVAGPDGARAVVHNLSDPPPAGPRMTPLSLPPGGSFLAPARHWAWDVSTPGALEIEVYDGSLAAFRVAEGHAVAAEVVDPGGFWSLHRPSKLRWGLILWMALLGAGLVALAVRLLALPVRPLWGAVLLVIALVPVLPALSTERLLGPFDLQIGVAPWRGPRQGPPFDEATPRLSDISAHLVPWQTEVRRQLLAGQVPLLDQRVGAGQALLGNAQSAPFSLLTLASLPFDPPTAQALRAYLKVLLALLGTFAVARSLGIREGYALAAALGYALCGSMAVWKLHPHTEVMGLWPWAYLGAERLIRGERRGHPALLAGAAAAGMLLAGHPETAAMAIGALALRWIWQVAVERMATVPARAHPVRPRRPRGGGPRRRGAPPPGRDDPELDEARGAGGAGRRPDRRTALDRALEPGQRGDPGGLRHRAGRDVPRLRHLPEDLRGSRRARAVRPRRHRPAPAALALPAGERLARPRRGRPPAPGAAASVSTGSGPRCRWSPTWRLATPPTSPRSPSPCSARWAWSD